MSRMKEDFQQLPLVKTLVIIVVFIIVILLLRKAVFTISTGEVGLLKTFGEYSQDELEPGLHFKLPIIQKVERFDVKQRTVHYSSKSGKDINDGIFYRTPITVLDDKKLELTFDVSVQFTPDQEAVDIIMAKYGANFFEKKVDAVFREMIRDVGGQYSADDVSSKRQEISEAITVRVLKEFETLPFILNDVNIRDIILPEVIIKKAISIQEANQEEERLVLIEKQNLQDQKNVEIKAQTALLKAQKEADAKAYTITTEANALAEANRKVNETLTNNIIKYKTIETWDGTLPTTSLQGGDGVNPNIILGIK